MIIESPRVFSEITESIFLGIEGGASGFNLLLQDNVLVLNKCALFCHSPLLISLNDKKFVSSLYKQLQLILSNEKTYLNEFNRLMVEFEKLLAKVEIDSDFLLSTDGAPSFSSMLKVFNVQVDDKSTSIYERLIDYISLVSKVILNNPIVIFTHILSFISKEEFLVISKHAVSLGVRLICIESKDCDLSDEYIQKNIIDSDLCLI